MLCHIYLINSLSFFTAVIDMGSSSTRVTCGTSQILLAGVSGGFYRGTTVFAPPTARLNMSEIIFKLDRKKCIFDLSHALRKHVFGFPTKSNTYWAVQPRKIVRGLKFPLYEVERL